MIFPTISLGASPSSVGLAHPTPELRVSTAAQGPATDPLFNGYGVLSLLVFAVVVAGRRVRSSVA